MIKKTLEVNAHAKCILAGEHTVMRGGSALVLPILSKKINLQYYENNHPLQIHVNSQYHDVFLNFLWASIHKALELSHSNKKNLTGKLIISNNIEMGAGLGFSAAICVVLAQWMIWKKYLNSRQLFSFSHRLENTFHGKSSGVDIAGALAKNLLHFETSGVTHEIKMKWLPYLYLSYSGSSKITKDAIYHVKHIRMNNPELANKLDNDMKKSVSMMEQAFQMNKNEGFDILVSAIMIAQNCFRMWELISPGLQSHMNELQKIGAIATKPTGAGGGGYVLSIWKDKPLNHTAIELIPVFHNHEFSQELI